MKSRLRIVLIAVSVVIVFGGQYLKRKKAEQDASTVKPTAPIHVKAVPRTYVRGSLTFKPCELHRPHSSERVQAWCSPFQVPENHADPSGRRINLNLALIRSDSAVARPDMVVFLDGGPGQAATQDYIGMAGAFAPLRKHHDILLLDQRGTGHSNPLTCPEAQKKAAAEKKDQPDQTAVQDSATLRKNLSACLAEVSKKADPRFYTTTDAVADLEAVRQAMGAPKFDLLGISYGTRMAQQYTMRHPDAVRSIVLDSALPNTVYVGEHVAEHLEQALKKDFAMCTADAACKKAYGDPYATLTKLREDVAAHPRMVSVRDPYTFKTSQHVLNLDSLASVVRLFAYTPETIALLPLSIHAAAQGDTQPLMGQSLLMQSSLGMSINGGMAMSVICSEDADHLTPRPQDKDTVLGERFIDNLLTECSIWPHGKRPADFHQPLRTDIPTLVLSGELDPITPPKWGKAIVADLGNARQIVLPGQGHEEFIRGCMPRVVRDFVDTPDPKTLDTTCLKRIRPIPMYVNFNGATP